MDGLTTMKCFQEWRNSNENCLNRNILIIGMSATALHDEQIEGFS